MVGFLLSACSRVENFQPADSLLPETNPIPTAETTETQVVFDPTPSSTATPMETNATSLGEVSIPEAQATVISIDNLDLLEEVGSFNFDLPEGLDWSQDGSTLAIRSREKVVFYDIENRLETEMIAFGEPEVVLDACADTGMVATTDDQMTIRLYLANGAVQHTLETQGMLYRASFSPDGSLLAIPMADEIAVELYNTETSQLVQKLTGFETAAPVYGAAFSSNGEYLLWISRGQVQPQKIDTEETGPAFGHQEFISSVALSSDSTLLAVSTAGTVNDEYMPVIQLWNTFSGENLGVLLPGDEIPSAIDISSSGDLLVNSLGSTLQFWNLETSAQILSLSGHTDRVMAVAFSPNGRMLASAALDGTVRLWRIMP
jgi:hypothetical protein